MNEEERKLQVSTQVERLRFNGKRVIIYTLGSGIPLLFVHGWNGRGTQPFRMIAQLAQSGFKVVSFDAPGHGGSSGNTASLYEIAEVLELMERRFGRFEIAIGHSLGALAILRASVLKYLAPRKIVLISAPVSLHWLFGQYCRAIGLREHVAQQLKKRVERLYGVEIWDMTDGEMLFSSLDLFTVLVHDKQDRVTPLRLLDQIRNRNRNRAIIHEILTQGLGHTRLLNDPKTISRLIELIQD